MFEVGELWKRKMGAEAKVQLNSKRKLERMKKRKKR